MTILYKPDQKVQVYKCIGEDLHTQAPVEIKGKRFKKYQTGEIQNKGVILFPDGEIRIHQVGSTPDGDLNFTLSGVSGTMAGGSGYATWKDPKGWLAGNTLFEGTLQK